MSRAALLRILLALSVVALLAPVAATASVSRCPAIERDRSMAMTTLLAEARLRAFRPTTALPPSVSVGAWSEGTGATSVRRTVG